ncbi:alpha/beta hydrolase, partial [Mycobacterium sp. ITM-2017-0098]
AVAGEGELAVMSSRGAQAVIDGMTSRTWENSSAPRSLFAMMRYRPGDSAPAVSVPLLVCVGSADKESPVEKATALAHLAPRGELRTYPLAHFDFYRDAVRQRITADQIAFLDRVLAGT